MAIKKVVVESVDIEMIEMRSVTVCLVGVSPLIMHRFSFKARQELLYPSRKKNNAERAFSMKHDPINEYRESFYRNRSENQPTLVHLPNGMPHQGIAAAALDVPGAKKTEIERWTQITDLNVNLFGTPQLFMAMVRNSDINKTPDVRTRPIFPEWACELTITYKATPLTSNSVINLIAAAGQIVGFGDWRPQKGGPFGRFRLVAATDKTYRRIMEHQGRESQLQAYKDPSYYDEETEELMMWFQEAVRSRRHSDDPIVMEGGDDSVDDAFVENVKGRA